MCIKLLIIIDYVNKCKIKQNFFNVSNNFYYHFLFSHYFRLFCLFSLHFRLNNMIILSVLFFFSFLLLCLQFFLLSFSFFSLFSSFLSVFSSISSEQHDCSCGFNFFNASLIPIYFTSLND